jgi:hypothetical protein
MVLRIAAVVWLGLVLASYTVLADRLTADGAAQAWAFWIAYSSAVIASAFLIIDIPRLWATLTLVVRKVPIRSAVLPVNLLVACLCVVYIGKHWGVIAVMFCCAAALFCLSYMPDQKRLSVSDAIVRHSPVTFAVLYVFLFVAEVYFRYHPESVGGGGGGNPALGKLYAGLHSYNSFGLRGTEFSEAAPEEEFRILAVGDSITFGQGVADHETFAYQLQEMLGEAGVGECVLVINAGKPGANTVSELRWLTEYGLNFAPDLVLLQFYLNDVMVDHGDVPTQSFYKTLMHLPEKSYALFFIRYRFWSLGESARPGDFLDRLGRTITSNGRGWQECAQALDEFGRLGRDADLPVVIVLFPHPGKQRDVTGVAHRMVAEHAREAGLHVIDLANAFLGVAPSERVVSETDHHPSARVHRIAAAEIAKSLRRLGLLPD